MSEQQAKIDAIMLQLDIAAEAIRLKKEEEAKAKEIFHIINGWRGK